MDSRVCNFFDRVTGERLWSLPPADAELYFAFRMADIEARVLVLRTAIGSHLPGSLAQMVLNGAADYLMDRRKYTPSGWSETI